MPKPKKTPASKTNGAAHAKPSKPAKESTQAPETSEAVQNAAAAPAPRDLLLEDLARRYPAWCDVEDVVARMKRDNGADVEEVRDLLDELESDGDVETRTEGTTSSVRMEEVRWWQEVEKHHEKVLEAAKAGFKREHAAKALGMTYEMAEKAIENLLQDEDVHEVDGTIKAGSQPATVDVHEYRPTRNMEHVFTEAEIHEMRLAVEVHHAEADRLQKLINEEAEKLKSLKKRYDLAIEDALANSRRIRAGSEWRDVPCEERREADNRADEPTYGKTMMVTYRLDTNEPIEWRELNYRERQGILFENAPAPTPAGNGVEQRGAL